MTCLVYILAQTSMQISNFADFVQFNVVVVFTLLQ